MRRIVFAFIVILIGVCSLAQAQGSIEQKIVNDQQAPLAHATVELLLEKDSSLVKITMSDTAGLARFTQLAAGNYRLRISSMGYATYTTEPFSFSAHTNLQRPLLQLQSATGTLQNVTVAARKPFIQLQPGKTVVNLEAGITHVGSTVLEALEKLPGVTIDKDGNISLKGKNKVLVLIDGKPTYLEPAQLAALLGGMSADQLSQVELMDQPSARYEAAGQGGIINIKTKKSRQKGFNGSLSTTYSQGVYPKSYNNLQLAFRSGKWSSFVNYSLNAAQNFTRIYALRRYLQPDETTPVSLLEQPSLLKGKGQTNNLRLGAEYAISPKTTLGLTLNGLQLTRSSEGNNSALWMDAQGRQDSLILTRSRTTNQFQNGGATFSFRHQFTASRELTADVDVLGYRIRGKQSFENDLQFPHTYSEATRADIPSHLRILSAKGDYSQLLQKVKLETGWKTSHIITDNQADYEYREDNSWKPDLGKTNHFIYRENIHALYANAHTTARRWTLQGGLRYELTHYDARQLGNASRKDSSFSRSYNSLFPSVFISHKTDSSNSFSLTAGRRIDRPAFQALNPFVFIINKYTYQQGNPYFRPQYTWNLELSHVYKEKLTSALSYSTTRDYFSQIFPIDSNGIVIYTEGNLGRMQNLGASVGVQLAPTRWWSFSAQAVLNHKKIAGILWKEYNANITQYTLHMNHQFRLQKGWAGELSGAYTSRSQQDLQEIVDPAGQLTAGLSKSLWQNKGSLKLAVRDIFYTQWMKGLTYFDGADEYFKLTRDTRTVTLSFSWRFGKSFKTNSRSSGAADEEKQRVGTGS